MNKILILLFSGLFCVAVQAQDDVDSGWMAGKEEGWFWYKDPKEVKPRPPQPPPPKPVQSASPAEPDAMSVAWLRKKLPEFLDRAIDNPTPDNVAAYLSVQRVALDKSQRFEEAAVMSNMTHPWLDQSNFVPVSSFANTAFKEMQVSAKEKAFRHLASIGGLFVFVDSKCQYCRAQAIPVIGLAHTYDMDLRFITTDGKGFPEIGKSRLVQDNGIAEKLGIKIFPTTVFVVPPSNYLVISQGMMSQDEMKDRMIMAAMYQHLLPKEVEPQINPWNRGVITTEDMDHGASDDPVVFNRNIQQKIQANTPNQ